MARCAQQRMDKSRIPADQRPDADLLRATSRELGLQLSDEQIHRLIAYTDCLEKWNGAYNLTAIRDRSTMLQRHIIESLAIAPYVAGCRIADVGTGAGLPGIPLAIAAPDREYVLLDSNSKKTRFLSEVKRLLGLSNIKVETARVETWHPEPPVDAVITRAFADLPTTFKRIDHLLGDHGVLFAMKTESVSKELTALPEGIQHTATQQIEVPGRQWGFQLLTFNRLGVALP